MPPKAEHAFAGAMAAGTSNVGPEVGWKRVSRLLSRHTRRGFVLSDDAAWMRNAQCGQSADAEGNEYDGLEWLFAELQLSVWSQVAVVVDRKMAW